MDNREKYPASKNYPNGRLKPVRKQVSILPKLFDGLDLYKKQAGASKGFIVDIAVHEFLKKNGIDVDLTGN